MCLAYSILPIPAQVRYSSVGYAKNHKAPNKYYGMISVQLYRANTVINENKHIVMQKAIIILGVALFAQSCMLSQSKIRGEGDIVKQEIVLDEINGIALGISADVYLTQDATQKVIIEAQQNIIDNIEREVRGGVWKIHHKKNVGKAKSIKIHISLNTLEEVAIAGSGSVSTTETFRDLSDLNLRVSGSGEMQLAFVAGDVEMAIAGSGEMNLSGEARDIEIAISGSGDINARDLAARDCDVAISGSGSASLHANGELDVRISGSGDVYYKGNTTKVRSSISGSGDVREL